MPKGGSHHSELRELATELAQPGPRESGRRTDDRPRREEGPDLEGLLRELQSKLSEAASDAEEVVTAHPLAAVASAFLLGLAIGRMMGRR